MAITHTEERFILCEGMSDKVFFCELINNRGLQGFQIGFPYGANETTGGITMFERFLSTGDVNPSFNVVKSILVVADNDNNPANNFAQVTQQIANAGYGVPQNELEFVTSPNSLPSIAVMMLPLNQQIGNLETVCKISAYDKWSDLVPSLNTYFNASDAPNWTVGHQDKMLLQCLLAATCKPNPYCTISSLYRENAQYHIPLNHPCFDDIAQFLTDWDTLLP